VSDAAFREVVTSGADVDVNRLPIQRCWPGDVGPLITIAMVSRAARAVSGQNVGDLPPAGHRPNA